MEDVKKHIGFLQEEEGQNSSMRVVVFIIVAAVLGIYIASNIVMLKAAIFSNREIAMVDFSPYALAVLISALTAKGGQKLIENIEKIADLVAKLKGLK